MKNIVTGMFLMIWVGCTSPIEKRLPDLIRITTLQDNRVVPDSLYPFLTSSDFVIQSRAIQALAQLQDTLSTDSLVSMAQRADGNRFEELVFALGQVGYGNASVSAKRRISDQLVALWSTRTGLRARTELLRAMGKTGFDNVHAILISTLADSTGLASEAAMAYGIMAYRHLTEGAATTNSDVERHLVSVLQRDESRAGAIYAAMRCGNSDLAPYVLAALQDNEAQIRMDAARAIGSMKLDASVARLDYVNALVERASNDPDWRVRVNAVNALATFHFPIDDLKKVYFLIGFEGRRDSNEHVRLAAIQAMPRSYQKDIRDAQSFMSPFYDTFIPAATWREQAAILNSLAQMVDVWKDARFTAACEAALGNDNRYFRAQVVQAIGSRPDRSAITLLEKALADSFALVRINAYGILNQMDDRRAKSLLQQGLDDADLTVLGVVTDYLIDDSLHAGLKPEELVSAILRQYNKLGGTGDIESRVAILDGLGRLRSMQAAPLLTSLLSDTSDVLAQAASRNLELITGKKYPVAQRKTLHPIDEAAFAQYSVSTPSVVVQTDRGEIVMDLLFDEAPLTVISFLRLVKSGFFDGVSFHRVVANFVVQGGDPTGTGWGGPGFTIRGEYNRRSYERGMVGMASAGKDTEGCQWFITHSAQPHLNGRYTIFGRVASGMDVVDHLQVGDRIQRISIR